MATLIEENAEEQTMKFDKFILDINDMFLVPAIIGPDKKKNAYTSYKNFVKEIHEFKEESMASLITVMDSKVKGSHQKQEKTLSDMKSDLMDYMRLQETEIANLRVKLQKLNDDMEDLLVEQDHSVTRS